MTPQQLIAVLLVYSTALAGGASAGLVLLGAIILRNGQGWWRVALRFAWRGLAVCLLFAAIYPQWMVFAPGVTPVFADAVAYVRIAGLGHAVMRFVAGPARRNQTQ